MTPRKAKNTTRQGANFELQIMDDLDKRGYDVARSSGSRGKIDVFAIGDPHILLIQAKITNPVLSPADRRAVRQVAARADAMPLVAYRINGVVCYRELIGQGPGEFEIFQPITHGWVTCGACDMRYELHREGSTCGKPDCTECPCGSFTYQTKEQRKNR